MASWQERLHEGLFQGSRDMPPPWGPVLRLLRYPAALARDSFSGEINIRAMSLAYTTLLSIVPLMAFTISILKGIGARGDLRALLHQFLRPMGGAADALTEQILQFVANMRGDVLGAIGFAFLVYTVITTIQKVEASFNFVWRVPRPRSLARRFGEYSSIMILGPLLLAAVVGLLGGAEHSPFARWLDALPPLAWMLRLMGRFMPDAIVTLAFTVMYVFIPNARVSPRAALVGGVTAGVTWALVGDWFAAILVYSSHMMAVYTGFAIVLTTLIWVYVSWLILLLGAHLAFYVQFPQYLRYGEKSAALAGAAGELAGLAVMCLIGRGAERPCWTGNALAAELDIPRSALAPVLEGLQRAGLIRGIEKDGFLPVRDPHGIRLAEIVDAVRGQAGGSAIESRRFPAAALVMAEVEAAIGEGLGDRSLGDMLAPSVGV